MLKRLREKRSSMRFAISSILTSCSTPSMPPPHSRLKVTFELLLGCLPKLVIYCEEHWTEARDSKCLLQKRWHSLGFRSVLLFDLRGDGVGVHLIEGGGFVQHLRCVLMSRGKQNGQFDRHTTQDALFGTAQVSGEQLGDGMAMRSP